MKLHEALDVWRYAYGDDAVLEPGLLHEAGLVVHEALEIAWRSKGMDGGSLAAAAQVKDDLLQQQLVKLYQRCADGRLPTLVTEGQARSYLTRMVQNALLDQARLRDPDRRGPWAAGHVAWEDAFDPSISSIEVTARTEKLATPSAEEERIEVEEAASRRSSAQLRAAAMDLLDTLAAHAFSSMRASARLNNEAALRQLVSMVFDGRDIHALILEEEGITAQAEPKKWKKAQTRLLRAHSRVRARLAGAVDELELREPPKGLSAQEAMVCRRLLERLERRSH